MGRFGPPPIQSIKSINGCSLGIRSEKVSSLRSSPRLYISDNEIAEKQSSAEELVMARDAIRVAGCSDCTVEL
jgi:hypothetical protein